MSKNVNENTNAEGTNSVTTENSDKRQTSKAQSQKSSSENNSTTVNEGERTMENTKIEVEETVVIEENDNEYEQRKAKLMEKYVPRSRAVIIGSLTGAFVAGAVLALNKIRKIKAAKDRIELEDDDA